MPRLLTKTLLLFVVCCRFVGRKTAGLGAGGGFFHCLKKTENDLRDDFQRRHSDRSPEMTQKRSPAEIRQVAPITRPLPGHWGGDSVQDRPEREFGLSRVTWPASGQLAWDNPHSPLGPPGSHPSHRQGA